MELLRCPSPLFVVGVPPFLRCVGSAVDDPEVPDVRSPFPPGVPVPPEFEWPGGSPPTRPGVARDGIVPQMGDRPVAPTPSSEPSTGWPKASGQIELGRLPRHQHMPGERRPQVRRRQRRAQA